MSVEAFVSYLSLEKNYSKHTVLAYEKDVLLFVDFCQKNYEVKEIDTVGYGLLRSWIVALVAEKLSNRSINRKTASLKAYYRFLQKIGKIEANPLAKHKALKISKKIEVPFSIAEMESVLNDVGFLDNFEGARDKLIVGLLYATGIRRIELVNLKLSDVDLGRNTIKVLGKRNKERIVPLTSFVGSLFGLYLNKRNELKVCNDKEFVFLLKSGNKVYENLVYRIINRYFSEVSSKQKKSPHILRHTFATHLLNEGADLNSVKELLGHSSLASTQVYTHNSIAELKKVHLTAHPRSKK
ncbi:tyrosine-type recombinase/integrase [Cellulophaga sp. F20128]|uniref:tyrosine-type recombinase/integrase n=1 Tax=Cellulophaga sp. F20128 TaxID=2926413 RepID=UPI001FF1B646|nr:tyrosine-type recombinase/integrase [Cellulophaga sp. F20128]MCK0158872.1 tyrosine-type recombinase/integrase [Cellulophaga sp. F20128]